MQKTFANLWLKKLKYYRIKKSLAVFYIVGIHGEYPLGQNWTKYLYRAVDSTGKTIDFYVSKRRDKNAAKKFFRKELRAVHNIQPRVITTDKYSATEMAILEEKYYGDISCRTHHRMIKYLNNIVEQDHRFIKRENESDVRIQELRVYKEYIE